MVKLSVLLHGHLDFIAELVLRMYTQTYTNSKISSNLSFIVHQRINTHELISIYFIDLLYLNIMLMLITILYIKATNNNDRTQYIESILQGIYRYKPQTIQLVINDNTCI